MQWSRPQTHLQNFNAIKTNNVVVCFSSNAISSLMAMRKYKNKIKKEIEGVL